MGAPLHPSIFDTSVRKLTVYRRPERSQPQERSWRSPRCAYLCIFCWLGTFSPSPWFSLFQKKGAVLNDSLLLQAGEVFSISVGSRIMVALEPVLADALPYLSNSGIIRNVI